MASFLKLAAACAVATLPGAFGDSSGVTPIQKVLELLGDMKTKAIAEKKAEAVRFAAFDQWCTDQKRTKSDEIVAGKSLIEKLAAGIQKDAAHIKSLTQRIEELDEDIGRWAKDKKSASGVREKESADFATTNQDYSESLSALDEAMVVLKKKNAKTAQAESLLQVQRLRLVPADAKERLTSFLQQPSVAEMPDEKLFNEAPEAYGYEFQSGGIIEMLEKLKDQFSTQKYELEQEEMIAQHAFEDIAQQLTSNTENAQHEVEKKTTERGSTGEAKAAKEGEKKEAEAALAEDEKYLDEATLLCTQKTEDFNSRETLRGDEIAALSEAIEVIGSTAVKGAGEKHLPQLLQSSLASTALAQLRSRVSNELQSRAASFLAGRARELNSKFLEQAASHAAADPFGKVKKMIKDLISTLMQESVQETEHKGWCDAELGANKITREDKTEEVQTLTVQKDELQTLIVQLSQDIQDLSQGVAELEKSMAEATQERSDAKAANEEAIAEAKAAQEGVQQAIAVLKDYYAKSSQATALVQQSPIEDAPETFDKPYQGQLPEGGNVVSFLEVILTDFARLESETTTSEQTQADTFSEFMFESKKDKALKENEKSHKEGKKADTEQALAKTEEELKLTQEQLDKANTYYDKLKPSCVDSGITYEERVQLRKEEIQSLEEALKILKGTDLS